MCRNPVLKPGFPSLFQHGQPEGIRGGWLCILPWYGTVSKEDPSIFYRSVDLFVLSDFAHDGLYYAGHIRAGSRGLGPNFVCLYRSSGQNCRCGGSTSSSSSSWAIWAISGSCVPGDSYSPCWSSAVCRCGPPSAGGADPYDRLPPPHAFSEVRRHFVGFSTTSPSAQDQDAITGVLLCHSAFSLELAQTGLRRTCTAGPYSSASSVHDGTSTPSWACSTSSWTLDYGTHTSSSSSTVFPWSEKHTPPPPTRAFEDFFRVPRPLLSRWRLRPVRTWQMPQDAGNIPQGPTQEMVQSWKAEWFEDMKLYWQQLQGDAPPQSTAGSAVSQGNMGPDALRPLSPSEDREASRAQHKSGTKRAGSDSRNHSSSRERSSVDRFRPRNRWPPTSPDSSSPTRHRSPTAKRSRRDRRERSNDSCSSEGRQRSQRHRRHWSSRSPGHWRRDHSPSPSPPRR